MTGTTSPRLAVASRRGLTLGLLTVALGAVGVYATWRVFVATAQGQRVELAVMEGAQFGRNRLWQVAEPILDVVSVPAVALVLLAAVVVSVLLRRWMLAIHVLVLVVGANLTTQVLKHWVFTYPDLGVTYARANSLPSGHTTVAASVAVAALLVVSVRMRPVVAVVGAAYAAATGISTVVGQWHRPSDAVASFFVVLAWGGVAVVLASLGRRRAGGRPRDGTDDDVALPGARNQAQGTGRGGAVAGVLVLFTGALVTGVPAATALHLAWTSESVTSRGDLLTAYAGAALGIAATSCIVFAWLLLVRQHARAGPRDA